MKIFSLQTNIDDSIFVNGWILIDIILFLKTKADIYLIIFTLNIYFINFLIIIKNS